MAKEKKRGEPKLPTQQLAILGMLISTFLAIL